MGTPGTTPNGTPEGALGVFAQLERPCTPLTAGDVAEELDCTGRVARRKLAELVEGGDLESKRTGTRSRVWWRPVEALDRRDAAGRAGDAGERVGNGGTTPKQFREFVRAVEDYAIFTLDADGVVADWNEGAARIKGYDEDGIVGEHVSTFYTEEDVERGVPGENLRTAAAEGRVEDEGWRVRKDGSRFWADVVITAVHDDDGTLRGFTKVTRDLTRRREYERSLEAERDLLDRVLDASQVGIVITDADGEASLVNDTAAEILGLSSEADREAYTPGDRRIYDEEGRPLDVEKHPFARAFETGEPVYDEVVQLERPEGTGRWLSVNAVPLTNEDGEVERVVSTADDVTGLKERTRELETELSEILGRVSDAFFALDEEWRFVLVNDRAAELFGRDRDDLLDESIWEVFPDITDSRAWTEFHAAMERQEQVSYERFSEVFGVWVEATVYPSDTGVSVYFRDITERKEREQELERYRTIVETVEDGVYVVDDEGTFTMVNEAYAEMTGYPREELVGADVTKVVDRETAESTREAYGDLLSGERETMRLEGDVHTADGGTLATEATFAKLPGEGNEYERIGVVRDVSERKADERELETRARQQDVVAEFGQRALGSPSVDDLFDEAVRAVADTLGTDYAGICELRDDELLVRSGVGWRDGVGGESTVEVDPDSWAGLTLDSTAPVVVDDLTTESRFDGPALLSDHDVSAGISTVVGPPENPWGVLGTYDADRREFTPNDVSFVRSVANVLTTAIERAEYEERLNETVDELRASNERLEQFAYIASHDLQEPLRMVSSYLQLLERRYRDELDEDAREFVDYAVDGAERMREMIDDLLAYSRVGTKAEPFEPTDSGAVFDRVLEGLRLRIEEEDAEVVRGDLPTVTADDKQLEQVFQNLVSNALKYRDEEEPPRIEVDAERRDGAWRFRVCDNGIGIDPAHADRIFDVFDRLHTREEYPGTGIGLALCERIVERHGGRIWVESTESEGSCFYFTIAYGGGDDR